MFAIGAYIKFEFVFFANERKGYCENGDCFEMGNVCWENVELLINMTLTVRVNKIFSIHAIAF